MNRSVVGSLLFVGGAMLVVLAPSGESAAQDLDGPTRGPVTATDIAPSPASLGIPFAAPAAPAHIVAASAGLKGLETPDLTLSANCGEHRVAPAVRCLDDRRPAFRDDRLHPRLAARAGPYPPPGGPSSATASRKARTAGEPRSARR